MPGFYSVFVGGDFAGTRLNTPLADKVALREIAEVLDPLFALYASARRDGEGFGDFCHRAWLGRVAASGFQQPAGRGISLSQPPLRPIPSGGTCFLPGGAGNGRYRDNRSRH